MFHTLKEPAIKLLRKVKRHILEEPRRFKMYCTITQGIPNKGYYNADDNKSEVRFPSCGTAACIAGWIVILTDDKDWRPIGVLRRAQIILGLGPDQASTLFYPHDWYYKHEYFKARSQKARARIAAKEIERFIRENR